MNLFISIRDSLGRLYGKHDTLSRFVLKFLLAAGTFLMINLLLGQMALLNNLFVVAGLAFFCSFMPSNSMLLVGTIMILLHLYGISLEAALAGGGMLVIIMLLYFSIAPKTAFPLALGAIATGLKIPGAAAILFGLISGPLSATGVCAGVLIFRLLKTTSAIGANLEAVSTDAADALMEKTLMLVTAVLSDREMILTAVLCVLVIWIVCTIRRLPIKYAWMIATAVGLFAYEAGLFAGEAFWGVMIDYMKLGIEAVVALLLAMPAQAILFNLDYKKTEIVQFEDDEYVYYVKAVPKRKQKRVQRRTERR